MMLSVLVLVLVAMGAWLQLRPSAMASSSSGGSMTTATTTTRTGGSSKLARVIDSVLSHLPDPDLSFTHLQEHALWRCNYDGVNSYGNFSSAALRALTTALEVDQPPLTRMGRWLVHENIVASLCTQLQLRKMELAEPHIFASDIKTLVIAGAPHTGTAELMQVMCQHPNASCVTLAEALDPIAPVYLSSRFLLSPLDVRWWKTNLWLAMLSRFQSHPLPLGPTSIVEEQASLLSAVFFGSPVFFSALPLPSYEAWFRQSPKVELEREVRKLLQLIQHQRGDGGVWIMPQSTLQINDKASVYPDAEFVVMHREHMPAIQSLMAQTSQALAVHCTLDQLDYTAHARTLISHMEWSLNTTASSAPPAVGEHQRLARPVMHVKYEEIVRNPVGTGQLVCEHAGLSPDIFL